MGWYATYRHVSINSLQESLRRVSVYASEESARTEMSSISELVSSYLGHTVSKMFHLFSKFTFVAGIHQLKSTTRISRVINMSPT